MMRTTVSGLKRYTRPRGPRHSALMARMAEPRASIDRSVNGMTTEALSNHRRHDLADAALEFAVVGDGGAEGDFGGRRGGDAARHHLGGVDEEAGRDALFEPVAAQIPHLLAD